MGILDLLLGRSRTAASIEEEHDRAAAAGGGVKYDPAFIGRLVEEHRNLLALFGSIKTAHELGDAVALKRALQQFLLALNMHLAMENSGFYAYLRAHLMKNTAEHMIMNTFWDEMQDIGKAATGFLRKYIYSELTPDTLATFGAELNAIGAALVTRIQHEEEALYPLYQPGHAAG